MAKSPVNVGTPTRSAGAPVPTTFEPDLDRAQQLVLELMPIPGKSGEEGGVAEYIRGKLLAAGAPADAVFTDNANQHALIKGNTGNLILRLPGTIKAPRRMLTAHMDT